MVKLNRGSMKATSGSRPHKAFALLVLAAVAAWIGCSREGPVHPNIVLVVVDALRRDHLGCYGYGRPTSPEIDQLANRAIVFDTAIAPAPWTKTSFSSFLTSRYPFQHGVVDWESVMPDTITTLAEVLKASGYSTLAVVNMLGITERFEVLRGIDRVSAAAKYKRDVAGSTADAIELMRGSEKPFFILIHYFDVHWPYRPPSKYIDRVRGDSDINPVGTAVAGISRAGDKPSEQAIEREMLLYDACIRYADEGVGNLVTFLEEEGLKDNTILIITADHGEAFWEHGVGSHGYNLYDEAVRVPLILDYPARYKSARRIAAQVGLIDLLPTLVDLAGVKDQGHREGRDLVDLLERGKLKRPGSDFLPPDVVLSESTLRKAPDTKSIRTADWKLIIEPSTAGVELYDLAHDPYEMSDVWGRGGAAGDSLFRLMEKVPGITMNGWRLGFTGDLDNVYDVDVRLVDRGQLRRLGGLVSGGQMDFEISRDSTSFHARVNPKGQQILLFGVEPLNCSIRVKFTAEPAGVPAIVYVGAHGQGKVGEDIMITAPEGLGAPDEFAEARKAKSPGVFAWWLPGEEPGGRARTTKLTPEEQKRLRSLGYIQ
jgi:arylsulfatase A-like enzyme